MSLHTQLYLDGCGGAPIKIWKVFGNCLESVILTCSDPRNVPDASEDHVEGWHEMAAGGDAGDHPGVRRRLVGMRFSNDDLIYSDDEEDNFTSHYDYLSLPRGTSIVGGQVVFPCIKPPSALPTEDIFFRDLFPVLAEQRIRLMFRLYRYLMANYTLSCLTHYLGPFGWDGAQSLQLLVDIGFLLPAEVKRMHIINKSCGHHVLHAWTCQLCQDPRLVPTKQIRTSLAEELIKFRSSIGNFNCMDLG